MWNGSYWIRVREWPNLIAQGTAAGALLGIPTGHVHMRIICDERMPVGLNTESDCAMNLLPWETCEARCKQGYQGSTSVFLCDDQYAFTGTLPTCVPMECTNGLPLAPEVDAVECLGIRTKETCFARCGDGFYGDPKSYICTVDGSLREARSRSFGVLPSCSMQRKNALDMEANYCQKLPRLSFMAFAILCFCQLRTVFG